MNEKIEKFICILWLIISNLLFGRKYMDIKILLNKAKSIKEIKRAIIGNFPKKKKFFASKFNSQRSKKKFATELESAIPRKNFTTSIKRSAKSLTRIKISNSRDYIYLNSKFKSMSKKLEKWIRL